MKRLFFSWTAKVGGTSLLSWINPNVKIFALDLSTYKNNSAQELLDKIYSADIVFIHGHRIPLYKKIGQLNWENFLSDTLRLAFIRNPINRFESIWRSSYEPSRKSKIIPSPPIPKFEKDEMGNLVFIPAHEQDEDKQISINEFLDLWFDLYKHDLLHLVRPKFKDLEEYNVNKRSSSTLDIHSYFNSDYLFNRNLQFGEIYWNLGDSFFNNPRKNYDILLPSEKINQSLSRLFSENSFMNSLLKTELQSKSSEELFKYFTSKSVNIYPEAQKVHKNTLNAKNRYIYSMLNKLDFMAWNTAIKECNY